MPTILGYATAEEYPAFGPLNGPISEFSGTIAYTCTHASEKAARAEVRVQDCNEAIEVFVNGKAQGMCIASPYAVEIALPEGACEIRVEVTNTLGHRQHAYDGGFFSGPSFEPAPGITGAVTLVIQE